MREKVTVGQLIRAKRLEIGCSQEAVAEHLGLSTKFISYVENGERYLKVDHLQKLSEFLEIPMKDFILAKVFEENIQLKLKKLRSELQGKDDEVQKAIDLARVKELRAIEIEDLLRFLEYQRQDYEAQIKSGLIHKKRVERQMDLLTEERELLGFGQLQFKIGGLR
jgi:transcriptional regulator with XRE-family HTH domain